MFLLKRSRILPAKRVIILAILTVLLLLVGTALLFPEKARGFLPGKQSSRQKALTIVPSLMLSASPVKVGRTVKLHIVHFTPSTKVLVTHDVGVAVQTDKGSSTIQVGRDGAADILISIDKSWQPGSHIIGAEDITTRYTASIAVQIET